MAKASRSSKGGSDKVGEVMHEFKEGTLESSSGRKVRSRKQAIAIGLSEAREAGENVAPAPKKSGTKKAASSKKSTAKKAAPKKAAAKKSTTKKTAPQKAASSKKSAAPKKAAASKKSSARK